MTKLEYPFQHTELGDLKGEKWKPIPGLEGYFMVSNKGRVKWLYSERPNSIGLLMPYPELIITPYRQKTPNHFLNEHLVFLTITLKLDNTRYRFSLARLVYYWFVKKFDLQDKRTVILNKDYNTLNILPDNLVKADLFEKVHRTWERGRAPETYFVTMTPAMRKKMGAAQVEKTSKPVTRYSLKGKKIKTYKSIAAAARATGLAAANISCVVNGRRISQGGFLWKEGSDPTTEGIESIRKRRQKETREKYGQKITQYDLTGKRIAHHPSLTDASIATGVQSIRIALIVKGVHRSAKGFYFKNGYGPEQIDLSGYKAGNVSGAAKRSKRVRQLSLKGKLLKVYPSVKDAAKSINVSATCISWCCKGKGQSSGGYRWQYGR
jgi:hypothetical protein